MNASVTMPGAASILVVDDEPDLRTLYELTLLREGHRVSSAASLAEARALLAAQAYDLVVTDMRLTDGLGLELLREMAAAQRRERSIVITAYGSAENAVEALKCGAFDYLTKPIDLKQFRGVVGAALQARSATPADDAAPAREPAPPTPAATPAPAAPAAAASGPGAVALARLVGESAAMRAVKQRIAKVARSMAPVLVCGESGTGKELVARAIHACSHRSEGPMVPVNCGAIPENLLEAEFFGARKGSYTGATQDRVGFFQAARGGTLFLDEIGELPLAMQAKLLRAIQERRVRPLGETQEEPVDVRIVSATHKDLAAEVQEGRFRQDLYYRLNVIQVRMPPLRERSGDLPLICDLVLARIARDAGVAPPPRLAPEALALLSHHAFPGNVRELENLLHRAVTLSGDELIQAADLGLGDDGGNDSDWQALEARAPAVPALPAVGAAPLPSDLVAHLDGVERDIIIRALELHRFNRTAAGSSLGLSLRQVRYRMARPGIQVAEHGPE